MSTANLSEARTRRSLIGRMSSAITVVSFREWRSSAASPAASFLGARSARVDVFIGKNLRL
jgi:hypothetical protein